jgi:hypothetical protein
MSAPWDTHRPVPETTTPGALRFHCGKLMERRKRWHVCGRCRRVRFS